MLNYNEKNVKEFIYNSLSHSLSNHLLTPNQMYLKQNIELKLINKK